MQAPQATGAVAFEDFQAVRDTKHQNIQVDAQDLNVYLVCSSVT